MKTIIIIFVSFFGLFGFAVNGFAQDVGAAAKQQADLGMTVSPKVTQLPEAARNALDAAGRHNRYCRDDGNRQERQYTYAQI